VSQTRQRWLTVAGVVLGLTLSGTTGHAGLGVFSVLAGLSFGMAGATALAAHQAAVPEPVPPDSN
jgi:hypothetical protein